MLYILLHKQAKKFSNEVSKLAAQSAPLAPEPPFGCPAPMPPPPEYALPAPGVPVGGYAAPVQMQMTAPASQPVTPMGAAGSAMFGRGQLDESSLTTAVSAPISMAASKELEELRAELAREVRPAASGRGQLAQGIVAVRVARDGMSVPPSPSSLAPTRSANCLPRSLPEMLGLSALTTLRSPLRPIWPAP